MSRDVAANDRSWRARDRAELRRRAARRSRRRRSMKRREQLAYVHGDLPPAA